MRDAAYKRYLLGLLLLVLTSNYLDRAVLGLALQDIKTDFDLSDTQVGLMTGIAFALFYSMMGIPIARWADRGNRVTIISLTTALWSVTVMLCGAVATFSQLLLARVGAAVGEAGCVPPAHSLISDHFDRAARPRALSIYWLGGSLSVVVGYLLAGWLNQLYGWRATFVILGAPGLILAALARLTLREPRREATSFTRPERMPSLAGVLVALWSNVTFRHLLLCYSISALFAYGIAQWQPTFFIRSFGLDTGALGTWFAAINGLGGLLGTYLGGVLASRYAPRREALQLSVMAGLYVVFSILSIFIYRSPNAFWAFGLMAVISVSGGLTGGPLFAAIQTVVPPRMRALSIAIVLFAANLIGMGLGPLGAGMLSDAFRPWAGEESLRYALMALCPGYLWGAWHLWRASRSVACDVERAESSLQQNVETHEPGYPPISAV